MIKTSSTHYILINKQGYENSPCIPSGKKEGDTIELICFMQPTDKRLVWIQRSDISSGELTQQTLI